MERIEVLPCLYRDGEGQIREMDLPRGEPDPYDVPADLYAPSYAVRKGIFGPAKLEDLDVAIFNTRTYRRDPELEDAAKDRLVQAILAKEEPDLVSRAGGAAGIREKIPVGVFWAESGFM